MQVHVYSCKHMLRTHARTHTHARIHRHTHKHTLILTHAFCVPQGLAQSPNQTHHMTPKVVRRKRPDRTEQESTPKHKLQNTNKKAFQSTRYRTQTRKHITWTAGWPYTFTHTDVHIPFFHPAGGSGTVKMFTAVSLFEFARTAAPHLTSPYLTSPHLTSPYLTLPYLTSPHPTSPHLTLPYLTSPYLTFPYLTLPHITSLHLPHYQSNPAARV